MGLEIVKRILDHYELDMFSEGYGQHKTYTVRVWEQGYPFIESTHADLETALELAEQSIIAVDSGGES